MRGLTGSQFHLLHNALVENIRELDTLRLLYRKELGQNIAMLDWSRRNLDFLIFDLIQYMDRTGQTREFVLAARRNWPESRELFELATELGLTPFPTSGEFVTRDMDITIDIASYQKAITSIEFQTCRIELDGKQVGAGILVAPRVVLTTYQVVEPIVEGQFDPDSVALRFDDFSESGRTFSKGHTFSLDPEWLIHGSPYSRMDMLPPPRPSDPSLHEMDYALLRVEPAVTDHPGRLASAEGVSRGFMNLQAQDSTLLEENDLLFTVQSYVGLPKKILLTTCTGFNAPQTRIMYAAPDTLAGTPGAAIFNAELQLVALHQGFIYDQNGQRQGVPVQAILYSQEPGFWDAL